MINVKLKFILFFILINLWSRLVAQEKLNTKDTKYLLSISNFLHKGNVIDKNFSSIPYKGNSLGVSANFRVTKKKLLYEFEVYYTKGILNNGIQPLFNLRHDYLTIDYTNLYNIAAERKTLLICKAGGGINLFYNERKFNNFINNDFSFESVASLSAVIEISYLCKQLFSGFLISNKLNIPLISTVLQPAFGADNSSGNINRNSTPVKSFFKNSRIVSLSSFFKVKNLISVEKMISSRQKLSVNYVWDYYQITQLRQVKQASQRIGLSYGYKF